MRRLLDIVLGSGLLIVLSPLLVIAGILVKATSPGPVFYRARRVGRGMVPFGMLKFRTMVAGADKQSGITVRDDPRVTKVGAFLRSTKIDELPQLLNVVTGDMTLIGPRPEDPKFVALYSREQQRLLEVRPGVTGPAQIEYTLGHQEELMDVSHAEEVYVRDMLDAKLQADLDYLRTRSAGKDLLILVRTAKVVLVRIAQGLMGRPDRRSSP